MDKNIHPSSVINDSAKIGKNVKIGPFTIIGPDVAIGDDSRIENNVTIHGKTRIGNDVCIESYSSIGIVSHVLTPQAGIFEIHGTIIIGNGNRIGNNVSIKGNTTIGEDNLIGAYTTLGFPAQDKGNSEKPVFLTIGDRNDMREYVSITCGSTGGSGTTKIGDDNMIMGFVHAGHDSAIGNHCVLANLTTLAGHVEIGSYVVTGGMSGIHQYCKVGDYAMIGAMSGASQDIAPYLMATGARASIIGVNTIGLKRNGFSQDEINQVHQIYDIFFNQNLPTNIATKKAKEDIADNLILRRFLKFIKSSSRGLLKKNTN